MRMREHDGVDGFGGAFERQVIALLDKLWPLIKAAVDIDPKAVMFDESARAGDKTGSAEKLNANRILRSY